MPSNSKNTASGKAQWLKVLACAANVRPNAFTLRGASARIAAVAAIATTLGAADYADDRWNAGQAKQAFLTGSQYVFDVTGYSDPNSVWHLDTRIARKLGL